MPGLFGGQVGGSGLDPVAPDPAVFEFNSTGAPLDFTLTSETRVTIGAVYPLNDAQEVVRYTIQDQSSAIVYTEDLAFSTVNYENLQAVTQNRVENCTSTILPAGTYTFTATIPAEGNKVPIGVTVRGADELGIVMAAGSNFHSGPWWIEDGNDTIFVGIEPGKNTRLVKQIGTTTDPIEVLSEAALDQQERYHSSIAMAKIGLDYYIAGVDHNSSIYGKGSPTLAGLAGAATELGNPASSYTYMKLAPNHDNTRAQILTRAQGTAQGLHFLTVNPTTSATETNDILILGGRRYPVDHQRLPNGLKAIYWQNRNANTPDRWESFNGAIYDASIGAAGQWYNFRGDPIGNNTAFGNTTTARFSNARVATEYLGDEGLALISKPAGRSLYIPGPPAIRVGAWEGLNRRIEAAAVYTTWGSDTITVKEPTSVGLVVFNGNNRVIAITENGQTNPFGVEPTNGYRGPSICFWDGADLIVAYAHRFERNRQYFYSTNNTNLYYDMTGSVIRVYRVTDALNRRTGAELAAAITQIDEFDETELGSGVDPNGVPLQVFNFQQISNYRFATQVETSMLDVSQAGGKVEILSVVGANASWRSQGRVLPTGVENGYRFNLTEQQGHMPIAYVPGVWIYASVTDTWSYDGTPPAPTAYTGRANFDGTLSQYIETDVDFVPDLTQPFSIRVTINGNLQAENRILSWAQRDNDNGVIDVGVSTTGRVRLFWRNEADSLAIATSGSNNLSNAVVLDGLDNVVEISYNGSNSVTITVNGVFDKTIAVTPSGTWTLDRFTIGSLFRNSNSSFFTGVIKDIELRLNGVLTNAWPLNEGTGLIARDTVGGKHGRIHNITNGFWIG